MWLFIADFYCREAKLVIEIDGKIHNDQQEYDQARDYVINVLGFKVVRFTNERVFEQVDNVISQIKAHWSPLAPESGKGDVSSLSR